MRVSLLGYATLALAARPFLNEPDTGIDDVLGSTPQGTLVPLHDIVGLPDFEWAARRSMNASAYTYYRNGAAGEWSYRNNLEVYQRFRLRPRVMIDITNIESTLPTSILGHNFSAPFFISPCARAGYAHEAAEANLVKAAAAENILYIPSLHATLNISQIAAAKANSSQVLFQQFYLETTTNETQLLFQQFEKAGSRAIVLTVDSAADGIRQRAARYPDGAAYEVGNSNEIIQYTKLTWDVYRNLSSMTSLPIIPKGIQSMEDARLAVQHGAKAIFLSNHGGRQIDTGPAPLEVALEIFNEAPEIFKQVEVYADGGVRYGTDILKLLALGVRAVGVGRPFMYSNVYGVDGVRKAMKILKHEIATDAANIGVADLKTIRPEAVEWKSANVWGQ